MTAYRGIFLLAVLCVQGITSREVGCLRVVVGISEMYRV